MHTLATLLTSAGGAASLRSIESAGIRRGELARAIDRGEVFRVRRAWFASHDAPSTVIRAVRVGGAATARHVAEAHGLWTLRDDRLHVRVAPNAARLREPDLPLRPLRRRTSVCVHHSGTMPRIGIDDLQTALIELVRCSSPLAAQVALDSALNRGAIDRIGLEQIAASVGTERSALVSDADGGCDSGLETIARVALRGLRIRYRTQVHIEGVGRVDVLIGDRLVLELDGAGFHAGPAFERDRARDLELLLQGYLVVRLSYRMVMEEWEQMQGALVDLVRRGEHRWPRRSTARFQDHSGHGRILHV